MADPLTSREIVILRDLLRRGASVASVSLVRWQRKFVIGLWRRELVEIWYRQSTTGSLEGPFFRFTHIGAFIAQKFFPAPRGSSGAEQANG